MVTKRKTAYIFIITMLLIYILPISHTSVLSVSLYSGFYVTNTGSSGAGSLRQAMLDADANAGMDYIHFNIPETDPGYSETLGVWFINLTTVLPQLTDPNGVVIDGSTQPGTHDYLPEIIIDASMLPAGTEIFTILSDWNEIYSLGLMSSQGNSIEFDLDADNNIISGNQIFNSMGYGIKLNSGSDDNSFIDNKICGHKDDGIYIEDSNNTFISGNVIGIQPSYIPSVLQNEGNGISCIQCRGSTIQGNTVSGNFGHGLYFSNAMSNLIKTNQIGLSEDGIDEVGNKKFGILLENNSRDNDIFENWISGNTMDGIRLTGGGTYNNHIEKNAIGLGFNGAVPNGWHGIGIYDGAHDNHIGNLSAPQHGNLIKYNGWSGVVVVNSSIGNNFIVDNYIETNQYYGIHINESYNNFIASNMINSNGYIGTYAGIRIEGAISTSNAITMNSISLNSGLGIQLVSGGNAELAAPVITSTTCTSVTGTTCPDCSVELYSDNEDEGRVFELLLVADASGNFSITDYTAGFTGPNLTAITFDLDGNTSQFSAAMEGFCLEFFLPLVLR